ncbi:MAG: YigZ family protein [Chloroflexi bacterium]|nr:YigZ family protein [Chloroflexota bacterium]
MSGYWRPKATTRIEYRQSNSRFYGTIGRASSVDEAKAFVQGVRDEMSDASHHVYAFIIGHGASVTEGMSDDGEPSGTSGPPALAVLRGSDIGDVVLVITRYFGGTKLGTGGLVHAYGQTAREAVSAVELEQKIIRTTAGIEVPYHLFEQVKRLMAEYAADIDDEDFAADVTILFRIPKDNLTAFNEALLELSAGQIKPTILDEG